MKGSGTGRVTRPALRAGVRSGWIGGLAAGPPAAATPEVEILRRLGAFSAGTVPAV